MHHPSSATTVKAATGARVTAFSKCFMASPGVRDVQTKKKSQNAADFGPGQGGTRLLDMGRCGGRCCLPGALGHTDLGRSDRHVAWTAYLAGHRTAGDLASDPGLQIDHVDEGVSLAAQFVGNQR